MPRVVDHAHRREEVARLAEAVICDRGLAGLTIRDVADRGGWSPTAVTHYFRNRDDLLSHTLKASRARATARVEAAVARGVTPLRAIVQEVLPLDEERTRQWKVWLAFWGSAVGSPELAALQRWSQRAVRDAVAAALRAEGFAGDIDFEGERIVALLDGVSIQAVFAPEIWPPERQLAQFGYRSAPD